MLESFLKYLSLCPRRGHIIIYFQILFFPPPLSFHPIQPLSSGVSLLPVGLQEHISSSSSGAGPGLCPFRGCIPKARTAAATEQVPGLPKRPSFFRNQ